MMALVAMVSNSIALCHYAFFLVFGISKFQCLSKLDVCTIILSILGLFHLYT